MPAVLLTYLGAVVIVRLVILGSRALLAPDDPARRLCVIGDRAARFLHRQKFWRRRSARSAFSPAASWPWSAPGTARSIS